jgi:hypothetical protein
MTDQHPITPPPELVHQWVDMLSSRSDQAVFTMVAQWGADQELEACINYFYEYDRQRWGENSKLITGLRAARRPKPPSLKEQALEALEEMNEPLGVVTVSRVSIIRRALEALDD